MLRLAADENFDGRITRGLFRLLPHLDLVRVQDTPLAGHDDALVLDWAAGESRVVLTHDVGTMTAAAWARLRAGLPMAGLIEVPGNSSIGRMIEEIRLIAEISPADDLRGQVLFLPL